MQFAGYDDLERLLVAEVGPIPLAADRVLGHGRVARSQIIKQADVLMAHHMIPDALRPGSFGAISTTTPEDQRTGARSPPAIHAGLLARAGRWTKRSSLFDVALRLDLHEVAGTSADGLHLGALGGVWQARRPGIRRRFGSPTPTTTPSSSIPTSPPGGRSCALRSSGTVVE